MWYGVVDGFVLFMFYDFCLNVVLEVLVCGLFIVILDICGVWEWVCLGENGWVVDVMDCMGLLICFDDFVVLVKN